MQDKDLLSQTTVGWNEIQDEHHTGLPQVQHEFSGQQSIASMGFDSCSVTYMLSIYNCIVHVHLETSCRT